MEQSQTQAVEDYLKAIYKIEYEQGATVTTTGLAEHLGLAPASVTNMLKKLADIELVVYRPYQWVTLSEGGLEIALRIIRYHRLVELFLVEKLGLQWDQVHHQAESWEHSLSDIVAERMDIVLGHPIADPHGSPIPSHNGEMAQTNHISLLNLEPGCSAIVAEVSDHDPELLRYLGDLGLYPGVMVSVREVAPAKDFLTIRVTRSDFALGRQVAAHIFVTNPRPAAEEAHTNILEEATTL